MGQNLSDEEVQNIVENLNEENVNKIFKVYDKNKNGFLEQKEFKKFIKGFEKRIKDLNMSGQDMVRQGQELIDKGMDLNRRGEYKLSLAHYYEKLSKFAEVDENKDEKISKTELQDFYIKNYNLDMSN
jgi:Ca2+-binding EF-hand superfamily protein